MAVRLDPYDIINAHYRPSSLAYKVLVTHSEMVAQKAVAIGERLKEGKVDTDFLWEAAMLHDIGMIYTDVHRIGCFGHEPYIRHGIIGRRILDEAGFPEHALVCERHTGVGLSREEIKKQKLPLPARDMIPVSLAEQIICYADCFYSKRLDKLTVAKPIDKLRRSAAKWGPEHLKRLEKWIKKFGE